MAEVLREQGYRTGAEIATPLLRPPTVGTQGFDGVRGPATPGVELKQIVLQGGKRLERPTRVARDVAAGGIEFPRAQRSEPFLRSVAWSPSSMHWVCASGR